MFCLSDGMLYTVVSHNAESSEEVPDGNPEPGSFMRDVVYGKNEEVSTDQLMALTKGAQYCEQYIKYECSEAKLLNSPGEFLCVYHGSQSKKKCQKYTFKERTFLHSEDKFPVPLEKLVIQGNMVIHNYAELMVSLNTAYQLFQYRE